MALAYMLKREHRADALAVGIETAKPETLTLLCQWAQIIILTDKRLDCEALDPYRSKVLHFDVGTDRWFHGFDDDLLARYRVYLTRLP